MSLGAQIREMRAAVKSLGAAAGKGRRCAYCRLHARDPLPDPKKPRPRPEDVLIHRCEFCGTETLISLVGDTECVREVARLFYSYTIEDTYSNPKAHALFMWIEHRPDGPERKSKVRQQPARVERDANARLLAKLTEEAEQLFARKRKALQSKYGESPFSDQLELIEAIEDRQRERGSEDYRVAGLSELRQAETGYMICAELEKIIWSHTTQETAAAIEGLGREIEEMIAAGQVAR